MDSGSGSQSTERVLCRELVRADDARARGELERLRAFDDARTIFDDVATGADAGAVADVVDADLIIRARTRVRPRRMTGTSPRGACSGGRAFTPTSDGML